MQVTSEMLTLNEVAERLKLSRGGVENLVNDGELPAVRIGKKAIRVRTEDLEAMIERGMTKPVA